MRVFPAGGQSRQVECATPELQGYRHGCTGGGGEWAVNVNDGHITVEQGKHPQPQLTIKASADDAVKLMEGKLNPMNAFLTGKVKAIGDIGLGMKLLNLIQ